MLNSLKSKNTSTFFALLLFLTFLVLSGCASNKVIETDTEVSDIDPYENFNRKVFVFNEAVDDYIAEPVSDAYRWVTPHFVQIGVANFFSNLQDINVILNDVMQGKFQQGAEDLGRFALNSTIGWFGLMDVAKEVGLEKHEEDFAQTLAIWGVPQGPYVVIPFLGPMTSRGVPGGIFDTAANPASYVSFAIPINLVQVLNARANAEDSLNFINEAALDPYVFTRTSFLQHRLNLITDGKAGVSDDLLDLEKDFYENDEDEAAAVIIRDNQADAIESSDQVKTQEAINLD